MTPKHHSPVGAIAVALIVAVIAHVACLGSKFAVDDGILIFQNPYVRLPVPIWRAFLSGGVPHRKGGAYRPLTMLSFRFDYRGRRLSPSVFHTTNMGLHLVNVALVGLLAASIKTNGTAVAISALLMALHPVLAEPVQVISHRDESLPLAFCLLSALAYSTRSVSPRTRFVTTLVCYQLALLAKEITAPLALALLMYRFTIHRKHGTKLMSLRTEVLGYAGCVASFAILRFAAKPHAGELAFLSEPHGLWTRLLLVVRTFGDYARLAVFPTHLRARYVEGVSIPWALTWCAALGVAAVLVWRLRDLGAIFGFTWFLALLAPVSNAIPLAMVLGERRIYVAFAGAALGIGCLADRLAGQRRVAWVALCLGVLFSGGSIQRSLLWMDTMPWLQDTIRKGPTDSASHLTLAQTYEEHDMLRRAQRWIEVAFSRQPLHGSERAAVEPAMTLAKRIVKSDMSRGDAARAMNNLGSLLYKQGRHVKAETVYRLALDLDPACAYALNNLGILLGRQGHIPDATDCYKRAIVASPAYMNARFNLGMIYRLSGQLDLAVESLRFVTDADPYHVGALNALGNAYQQLGEIDRAMGQYRKALRVDSDHWQAMVGLAACLLEKKQPRGAAEILNSVLLVRPDCVEAWYNLAEAYRQMGDVEEAVRMLKSALIHIPPQCKDIQEMVLKRLRAVRRGET